MNHNKIPASSHPVSSAENPHPQRREFLAGGLISAAALAAASTSLPKKSQAAENGTFPSGNAMNTSKLAAAPSAWPELGPTPVPLPEHSAGPIRKARGSDLTGKVAIVTGAARGIGRAIAIEYAANGADVAILDICGKVSPVADAAPATSHELDETARQIRAFGRKALPIKADIRNIRELRKAANLVEENFGKIDILVANAAIQGFKPILEMEDKDWDDQIENNLNGTARTLRAFVPKMVPRKYGRIIIISSLQGKHGARDGSSYSASKWALLGLMKSAAKEFGPYNITVNAILPGLVGTALTLNPQRLTKVEKDCTGSVKQPLKSVDAWNIRARHQPVPVGWLQPEDISPMAVFLASDSAVLATGGEYAIDGGDSADID